MYLLNRRSLGLAVLAVVTAGSISIPAEAGFPTSPRRPPVAFPTGGPLPTFQTKPPLTMRQSYNRQVRRYIYGNVPPYLWNYNPYLPTYNPYLPPVNLNPNYLYPAVTLYPVVNPYAVYAGLYNPYVYGNYLNPAGLAAYAYLYQ